MERHRFRLKSVVLAGIFLTAGACSAFAVEADQVGERLKALLARQQIEFTYDSARMDGDDVTLEGVTAKSTDGKESLPLGELTLQDVTEEENGAFRVGTFALDEFEHQDGDVTVSLIGLTMTGLVLPADAASDPFGMRYDHLKVARVDVDSQKGPLASLENVQADLSVSDEDGALHAKGAAEAFSLNLRDLVKSANAAAMLEELGYGEISGSARMEGLWRPSDGRITLTRYDATVDNAGALHMMVDLAGYTPDFIRALEEMAKQSRDGGQNNSAQGIAMLGLMQQLTFHGVKIRFTDDTLTRKVLAHIAEKQGSTPADVITQAKAVIPMQVGPFLGPELTASLTQAVGTFLENPDNLEVSAVPENPVPFALLMGAAMGAPEMLVRQIGLTVTANQ